MALKSEMGERGFAPGLGTDGPCSGSLWKGRIALAEPRERGMGGSAVGMLCCSNDEGLHSPAELFPPSQSAAGAEQSRKQRSVFF